MDGIHQLLWLLQCWSLLAHWSISEVQNAAINVPRAMFFTIFINGALGFATYIFMLYCFGDVGEALKFTYGLPFVEIFYNALGSKAGATALISLLIALYIFATFAFVAAASRQAWAFSRDGGLPLSRLFKRVSSKIYLYHCVLTIHRRLIRTGLFRSGHSASLPRSTCSWL